MGEYEKEAYRNFLRTDPEWKQRCRDVWKRCNGICERCGYFKMTETHHIDYSLGWLPPLWHLKGLCHGCHSFIGGYSEDDPLDFSLPAMMRRINAAFPTTKEAAKPEESKPAKPPLDAASLEILQKDRQLESDQDGQNERLLNAPKPFDKQMEKSASEKLSSKTKSTYESRFSNPSD